MNPRRPLKTLRLLPLQIFRSARSAMRQAAIFILSLPLLALAIAWVPASIALCVVMFPIWGSAVTIFSLRGEKGMWGFFVAVPLCVPFMYLELTGFFPRLHAALDKRF
jgi:hypothetical protein